MGLRFCVGFRGSRKCQCQTLGKFTKSRVRAAERASLTLPSVRNFLLDGLKTCASNRPLAMNLEVADRVTVVLRSSLLCVFLDFFPQDFPCLFWDLIRASRVHGSWLFGR